MSQELEDKKIAEQFRQQYETGKVEKSNQPTEIVTLPSRGYFYHPDNSLSSGQIEIRYPTARDEDILTSRNLISKGVVIDRFLQSIIVSKINYDTLLLGDKNGIMVAARILAYGSDYVIDVDCPSCRFKNKNIKINLSEVGSKDLDFDKFEKGQQEFEVELKDLQGKTKHTIKFKLLTHADIQKVDEELKGLQNKNISETDKQMTTRLKHAIIEVDGKKDRAHIYNFVENLLSRDSLTLRTSIKDATPDVDLGFDFQCRNCNYEDIIAIPLGIRFFWPSERL